MALNQNFPFNYKPTDTITGDPSTPYQCPTNSYALVTVFLAVSATGSADIGNGDAHATASADSMTAQFWVKGDDIVSCTATPVSVAPGAQVTGSSNATFSIDVGSGAIQMASVTAGATAGMTGGTCSISGSATAKFIVDEYQIP